MAYANGGVQYRQYDDRYEISGSYGLSCGHSGTYVARSPYDYVNAAPKQQLSEPQLQGAYNQLARVAMQHAKEAAELRAEKAQLLANLTQKVEAREKPKPAPVPYRSPLFDFSPRRWQFDWPWRSSV